MLGFLDLKNLFLNGPIQMQKVKGYSCSTVYPTDASTDHWNYREWSSVKLNNLSTSCVMCLVLYL